MLADILWILLGLALLYFGAEGLVRGSSSLALRLGLTPLVVGLTVVAYGTSMPELIVSVKSAMDGQSGIAVGNVVGSNIFNIAVILGVAAVIYPIRTNFQLIKVDVPIMLCATVLAMIFMHDGFLSRGEAAVLFGGIILYTIGSILIAKRSASAEVRAEYDEAVGTKPKGTVLAEIGFVIGGLALLVFGSRFLVDGSISLARTFGISEAVIGLTIVAAGTSTPELAATIVAALKKEPDIALGNIVGSNIYNILCILGVTGLIHPLSSGGVTPVDFAIMFGTSILLLPILWTGFTIRRWEGFLLLAVYGGYLWWLWPA